MAATTGKKITCDRCGKQIFIKCVGEGRTDGGFTSLISFEPIPDGWSLVAVPDSFGVESGNAYNGYIQACDECHALWDKLIIDKFLKGTLLDKMEQDG